MLSAAYRRYALTAMTSVYMLHVVDRWLMILLLQPIKEELDLTDTQLGFVTGIAFALFSVTAGLLLSRWADRGNRAVITSFAISLWAATVMVTMFVGSYVQLVLARIAAAVGESGVKPPTFSLVGDYFPSPAERTRALSTYFSGNFLGSLLGLIVGGWLAEKYGWRVALFLVGLPGLLMAVVFWLTIVEPRVSASRTRAAAVTLPPMMIVLRTMWEQRACRHLIVALVLLYTVGSGLAPWFGAFLVRSHEMKTAELGVSLGLVFGLGGLTGVLCGGYVATRRFADDERGQMRMSAITVAALTPCLLAFLTLPHKYQALVALVPVAMAFSTFLGPTYAVMQRLVPAEMRATVVALVMVLVNLIGMGFGPQVVGILSDHLAPAVGIDSLRYAMLLMSLLAAWSGYHFWQVGHTVKEDLEPRHSQIPTHRVRA
jgi:MFS family permease